MENKIISDIERMAVLKSIDIFKGLEAESLYQVLKIARYVKFKKDEYIVTKGEKGDRFYVILEGSAAVYVDLIQNPVATITQGGIIGELAILDKQERTAWVIALEETLTLEFNGDAFIALIRANNTIAFSMARTLSQRLKNTIEGKAL